MSFIIRKAKLTDVPAIFALLKDLANQGLLLPRSYADIYEMLQTFYVAKSEPDAMILAGVGALQITWEDLAEVRSLAVAEEYRMQGLGRGLTEAIEAEARSLGVRRMFSLTYKPGFFEKMGYRRISLESLPKKIWTVCINCIHYPNCLEIPMGKEL
ncbi:MAG: N-acetyltransferase [Deltaproteobacteria bacterium]|jgi:amino-acid N-acetyltransferase|nr:N-acetyltransferase [Deltaproteobacteria bacterium]